MNNIEKIRKILAEIIPELEIKSGDQNIKEAFDSVALVSLIVELENEFQIIIDDNDFDIENYSTVNCILDLLKKYKVE